MTFRSRYRLFVPVLISLALLAAACGGDDDDETTGAPPAAEEAGQEAGEFDTEATLRVAYSTTPSNLDPARSTVNYDRSTLNVFYDRLVHTDPETSELIPGLATEWTPTPEGDAWEFKLREGVTFHDGAPLDAEAVKANLERMKEPESNFAGQMEVVTGIEVADDLTVTISVVPSEGGVLPALLADRPGMMVSPQALESPDLDQRPVGAGLFRVTSYQAGSSVTLERFEDYWDEEALEVAPAALELRFMPDENARINALKSGQVDAINIGPDQVDTVQGGDIEVDVFEVLTTYNLRVNRGREPFDDPLLRKATSAAIDRETIVDTIFNGYGTPVLQPFPPSHWASVEDPEEGGYDPERAKELLAEAGKPDGFSFRNITLPQLVPIVEAVQAQLAEVGIEMEVIVGDPATFATEFYRNDAAESLLGPSAGRPDPIIFYDGYFSPEGSSNACECATDEMIELLTRAKSIASQEEHEQQVRDVTQMIVDETLDMYLWTNVLPIARNSKVQGRLGANDELLNFRGVGVAAG